MALALVSCFLFRSAFICVANKKIRSKPRRMFSGRDPLASFRNAVKNTCTQGNVISTDHEGPAQRETEGEWRDPDNVSAAMRLQGILPRKQSGKAASQKLFKWRRLNAGIANVQQTGRTPRIGTTEGHTVGISPVASGAALLRRRSR